MDIGVRVELPAQVFEHITDVVYESKLVYRTKAVRGSGAHLLHESLRPRGGGERGGHQHRQRPLLRRPQALRSENTNFALLVSNRFTQPFNEPYRYGKHIASLSNMLAGGVLVQRFGDLVKGVRTNEHRMRQVLHPAHPHRRRPRGPVPGPAQAAAGRHH